MVEDVQVSVTRTTPLTHQMAPSVLEGDVVVVKADQVSIKKDQSIVYDVKGVLNKEIIDKRL